MLPPHTLIGECRACADYGRKSCFCRVLKPMPNWGCQEWTTIEEPPASADISPGTITGEPDMDLTDSNWYMTTTGMFLQFLVDSGHDPAIEFQVYDDHHHGDGTFTRYMQVISIPNGHVVNHYNHSMPHGIHRTLRSFIEAGLVT